MWYSQMVIRPHITKVSGCAPSRPHIRLYDQFRSYTPKLCRALNKTNVRSSRLPNQAARTRFAPSPTGYLHLGSLRTALYNFLLARITKGQFILRLEDTDQSRMVSDAEDRLYKDLSWTGISWDEGPDCGGTFGPYKQSSRLQIYQDHAAQLLCEEKAFRCFCSHDDLAAHNRRSLHVNGTFGGYPGRCLSVSVSESAERAFRGEPYTIRFKSNDIPIEVNDIVYGAYQKKMAEDHFIIIKSDGYPTYHFANVVDDHLMKITHVIRGAEWLVSTSKHVSLYNAFRWAPPTFAHVGLLVNSERQKLSKRSMDIGIDSYRKDGVLPTALLNFAALLGWNPETLENKGVMTLDRMIENFGLKFTKGDIVVDAGKLTFFNRKHYQLAIHSLPPSSPLMNEFLVDPILQKVSEIEMRRRDLKKDASQADAGPESTLLLLGDPLMSLGEMDREVSRRRVYYLLKITQSDCATASEVVDANKFLIWEPSNLHITNSFQKLYMRDDKGNLCSERDDPLNVMESLQLFIVATENIDTAHWTLDNIRVVIGETVKNIIHQSKQKTSTAAVYSHLRWAILGLTHGQQISVVMEFLGSKETQRRLQLAKSIAESSLLQVQELTQTTL